jgi:protein-tyrosine kinase
MSRFYDASKKWEREHPKSGASSPRTGSAPFGQEESTTADGSAGLKHRLVNFEIPLESRLVALTEPRGLGAQNFRLLSTRLADLRKTHKDLKSLQVTSAVSGEGKTLISVNLGLTFALLASKVLLIEGDLKHPHLAAVLGLSALPGLADWWPGERADIQQFLYQVQALPLWILLAGGRHEEPSKLLQSPKFAEAFALLAGQFDWIVVDSPPLTAPVEANSWSRLVDGALLVVREGVTPLTVLRKSLVGLEKPKFVGMVCNEISDLELSAADGK